MACRMLKHCTKKMALSLSQLYFHHHHHYVWSSDALRLYGSKVGAMTIRPRQVKNLPRKSSLGFGSAPRMPRRSLWRREDNNIAHHQYGEYEKEEEVDEYDHVAHSITTYGSKHSAVHAESEKTIELLKLSSFVKEKTLENRYFKPQKSPNLLTWACKEQMRFFHLSNPDTWTIEVLAQKFPVSETSVKKIVKSRVRLHRFIDIKSHDESVKKNWEKLRDWLTQKHNATDDEDIKSILDDIGNMDNVTNIFPLKDGIDQNQISLASNLRPRKLGMFSSIVKDELEKKEMEDKILIGKHLEQLDDLKNTLVEIRSILENFESSRLKKTDSKVIQDKPMEKSEPFHKKSSDPFKVSVLNKNEKTGSSSYLVDQCVYDENGDFLYRIP